MTWKLHINGEIFLKFASVYFNNIRRGKEAMEMKPKCEQKSTLYFSLVTQVQHSFFLFAKYESFLLLFILLVFIIFVVGCDWLFDWLEDILYGYSNNN